MTRIAETSEAAQETPAQDAQRPPLAHSLLKLARPKQWAKSVFVLVGPFYGLRDMASEGATLATVLVPACIAAIAFALASSGCYVFNDLSDREADRLHPRKRKRPIASGAVSPVTAGLFGGCLLVASFALTMLLPPEARWWVALVLTIYIANVFAYSAGLKHLVIVDVMCLATGFVLRVIAGCAAVGIAPSVWLLNVTLFLAMFLSFGKRLGERRTLTVAAEHAHDTIEHAAAAMHRPVQGVYTDAMLRMMVGVTGVATLVGYAGYVQDRTAAGEAPLGPAQFSLLWLTVMPATYCLLRSIVLLERGDYDDPTELATRDRMFQAGAALFAVLTAALLWMQG